MNEEKKEIDESDKFTKSDTVTRKKDELDSF